MTAATIVVVVMALAVVASSQTHISRLQPSAAISPAAVTSGTATDRRELAQTAVSKVSTSPLLTDPEVGLSTESQLDETGLGAVLYGMTLEDASRAAGRPIRELPECPGAAVAEGGPPEVWLGVRDGHVVNLLVQNPAILTTSGLHVTDSEAEVLHVFPRARRITRPYVTELVVRHTDGLLVFSEAVHVDHAQDGIVTAINAAPNQAALNMRASCD